MNKSRKQEGKIKFRSRLLNVILKMNKEYKFFCYVEKATAKMGKEKKSFATKFPIQNMTWCSTFYSCLLPIVTFASRREAMNTKCKNSNNNKNLQHFNFKVSGNFVGVNLKLDSHFFVFFLLPFFSNRSQQNDDDKAFFI